MNRLGAVTAGALLLSIVTGGCATGDAERRPDRNTAAAIALRTERLAGIERYVARGKLGIFSDTRSLSSRVRWDANRGQTRLELIAPLGLGRWQLVQEGAGRAWLRDERGQHWQGASIDALLARALGERYPVPLAEIGNWMKGLPGNGDALEYDAQGRLERLVYRDAEDRRWRVWLRRYREFDEYELPALITANGTLAMADGEREPTRMRWLLERFDTTSEGDSGVPAPPRLTIPSS